MNPLQELVELFQKKELTRAEKRNQIGILMVLFLVLTGILFFVLGKTLIPIISLIVTIALGIAFFSDALDDPEWTKGETYD
jgi:hypothetical protein